MERVRVYRPEEKGVPSGPARRRVSVVRSEAESSMLGGQR